MSNPAEIKKTINKAIDNLALVSAWEGRNGVRYHQVFSCENDCVYLIEAAEEIEKDIDALLIYNFDCVVYDASDKKVGEFDTALTAAAKYCKDVRDIHFNTNSFKQKETGADN